MYINEQQTAKPAEFACESPVSQIMNGKAQNENKGQAGASSDSTGVDRRRHHSSDAQTWIELTVAEKRRMHLFAMVRESEFSLWANAKA